MPNKEPIQTGLELKPNCKNDTVWKTCKHCEMCEKENDDSKRLLETTSTVSL